VAARQIVPASSPAFSPASAQTQHTHRALARGTLLRLNCAAPPPSLFSEALGLVLPRAARAIRYFQPPSSAENRAAAPGTCAATTPAEDAGPDEKAADRLAVHSGSRRRSRQFGARRHNQVEPTWSCPAPFGPISPVMLWLRSLEVERHTTARQAAESPDDAGESSSSIAGGGHLALNSDMMQHSSTAPRAGSRSRTNPARC
jgi:hypothetical protein